MTGRLELHCLDLRQADDEDEQLLSEEERQRAARFVFPQLRLRFIAAHSGLRRQLGHILGVSPASLVFQSGPHGKPFLPAFPQISFNLSHSGDLGLLAIWHEAEGTPPALGVDVEACRTSSEFGGVSRRFYTPSEQRALPSPDSPDFHRAFLSIWTRKEAVTKCLGTGLRTPLNSFSVLGPAPTAAAERTVRHEEISSPTRIFFKPQGGIYRGLTAPRTVNWIRPAVSHATSHDTPGEAATATSLDVPCKVPHGAPPGTLCTYAVDFAAWGTPQYADSYVAAVCLFLRE